MPRTLCALCGFLGLTGYYRRFIHNYSVIATPLTALLKRDAFRWSDAAAAAFDMLKSALTSGPVLQLPDFTAPFVINCDASGSGFGAVLHQSAGPIAFFSRAVAPQHAKLAAYERELIGLVKAVRHWRPYVWARPFTIRTDHFALKFLLDQRLSTIPQHTWVSKLFGYDFKVEYKPGRQNAAADALSRRDEDTAALTTCALSRPDFDLFHEFRAEAETLPDIIAKRQEIDQGLAGANWTSVDGFVLHRGRIFVPDTSALWPQILATAHGAGHEGVQKTRAPPSTARTSAVLSATSCRAAPSVSITRRSISIQPACCSRWTFPTPSGPTSPWILLKAFPRSEANRWFSRWLIASPSMHISSPSATPTAPPLLPRRSSTRLCGSTGCHAPSSATGTRSLPAPSGPSSFACLASRCASALPSTPKLMVSQRSPTVFSASTFAASPAIVRGAGCGGCPGQSSAIIHPSRQH